jgi:hypothetical protein
VCHATHSSSANAFTSPGPLDVSITPLPLLSLHSSGRDQNFVIPPIRFATTTALPSMLTLVRDGLPLASGRVR